MNNLRMPRGIVEASLSKRIQKTEEGISVNEDKIKEMDTLVKKLLSLKYSGLVLGSCLHTYRVSNLLSELSPQPRL